MPPKRDISELVMRQNIILSLLSRTEKFADLLNPDDESAIAQVQCRLDAVKPLQLEFIRITTELELKGAAEEEKSSENDEVIEEFESRYFALIAKLSNFLISKEPRNSKEPSTNYSHETNVRLPLINLPSFKGDYTEWTRFKDSFLSLIHHNKSLQDVQRLHYLKACLKSPAADIIANMQTTDSNYKLALDQLTSRYENQRLISNAHVSSLFSLAKMKNDSLQSLKEVTYEFFRHVKALKSIGENVDASAFLLLPMLTSKLDNSLLKRWEGSLTRESKPTLDDIEQFLLKQIDVFELSGGDKIKRNESYCNYEAKSKNKFNDKSKFQINKTSCAYAGTTSSPMTQSSGGGNKPNVDVKYLNQVHLPVQSTTVKHETSKNQTHRPSDQFNYPCHACKLNHKLYMCPTFLTMTPSKRLELVTNLNLCVNCFHKNHTADTCRNKFKCRVCNLPHNTLIHQDQSVIVNSAVTRTKPYHILLATAVVDLITPQGKFPVRALLDGGSQSNFLCQSLVQQLKLPTIRCNVPVKGIGLTTSVVTQKVNSVISSRVDDFNLPMQFLVLPKITDHIPQEPIDISKWKLPPGIQLADPEFNHSKKIQLLIGAEYFLDILSEGQLKINESLPSLQCTKFGWIISGKYPASASNIRKDNSVESNLVETQPSIQSFFSVSHSNCESNLDTLLPKFWELENCGSRKPMSWEDQKVEKFFSETVQRETSGRYSVGLPFNGDPSSLGTSAEKALNCFYSLEKRFLKNPSLKNQYQSFMSDYLKLGHMRELFEDEYQAIYDKPHYFLPHHAVMRDCSITTKLRVVFNGSMPTSSGVSLNEILAPGPPLQTDSFSILLRFRSHKYGMTSDVEKMFRQIKMLHPYNYFQLIFWRNNPDQPIKIFTLLTVTYGTTPAPYLAIKTLHQLASDEANSYPIASKILQRDFYVDDLISGEDSIEALKELQSQLNALLLKGGMSLRKWCTNCSDLYDELDNSAEDPNYTLDLSKDDSVKTLGVFWHPFSDLFVYNVKFIHREKITKRTIVSDVCRVYDPLGLLGPAIMMAKLFIRDLWLHKLSWDSDLPSSLENRWLEFVSQCSNLDQSSIPRYFCNDNTPASFELHGFCDASEQGYGACFYIKSTSSHEESSVFLLCSKSRVAPTKAQSIPRLELCGALLLSELYQKVRSSLTNISFKKIFLWTDSVIVLHWIAAESCRWKTFVGNRVSQIQENTPDCSWMHVSTMDNPADQLSRGSCVLTTQWWKGPSWLASTSNYTYPELSESFHPPDKKSETNSLVHITTSESTILENLKLDKFSSWSTLYRVVAYIFRFRSNCLIPKKSRVYGELSVDEIGESQICILKIVQQLMFPVEIKILLAKKNLPSSNRLLSLNPFIDSQGLLRVGGRLRNAPLIDYNQKHPILLCSKHPITTLIVRHYHRTTLHAGPQHMLYNIRHRFWPINGKNLCKKIVRECTTCFRVNPKPLTYLMGDLPVDRLKVAKPFTFTGVDFAGPFMIRQSRRRNAPLEKAYACLFICMSTKALHIEAVSELTSNAFIACLRRFISRRGVCKTLFCDNGRNFVGADRQLKDIYQSFKSKDNVKQIESCFSNTGICFQWIPARSPTFAGLWERAVKSCKHHLRRVMGTSHLTFEELSTLLTQIEAQLNSRPLTPMSDNPLDISALSPSHFLVGESLTSVPDVNIENEPTNLLNRWQRVQQAQQQFWRRWSAEYLGQLQHRSKWRSPGPSPQIGQLVLLKDENTPPLFWNLARITSLHPGNDDVVRVATVKTKTGETRRALTKLCPIPLSSEI